MFPQLLTLLPILTSWERCALNLIEKHRPSSVFFSCKSSDECPSNNFYKMFPTPSQTFFGLDVEELPTFKATDLIFMTIYDIATVWNNSRAQKYRLGGENEFMLVLVANKTDVYFMETFFATMWESGIVKCAVLVTNETMSELFTYIPFQRAEECENTRPVSLGECSSAADTVFDLTFKVQNLNNCPLRIVFREDKLWVLKEPLTGQFSGRLVNLFVETASRMNFSILAMEPKSTAYRGPTCTAGRADVVDGLAHMAVGPYSNVECNGVEYVRLLVTTCTTWCTPLLSESDYVYFFVVRPFELRVWLALIVSILSFGFSLSLLCFATSEIYRTSDVFNLALAVYAQVPRPDYRTTPVRIAVAFWLFTCLVVQTAYEAEIKSQNAVPLGLRTVYDLKELLEAQLHLCTTPLRLKSMGEVEDPLVQQVYYKTRICDGFLFDNLMAAAKLKDRAVYMTDISCRLTLAVSGFDGGSVFPGTGGCTEAKQFPPIVILRGSPFKKVLAQQLDRSFEVGLVAKWLDLRDGPRDLRRVEPIDLDHLLPALFVLAIGCIAGCVSLMIEIAVSKFRYVID